MNIVFIKNIFGTILACTIALLLGSCNLGQEDKAHAHDEYTCPMHPQVIKDKPGTCPICGMDLVKKSGVGQEGEVPHDVKVLSRPTNESVVASINTIRPERRGFTTEISAPGVITYDTRRTYSVPVRFGGRIEKLFLKYNFQPVRKGQVIMEIYSPELITAQRELLYVVNSNNEDGELVEAAKQKLLLLGATPGQIEKIISSGKESFTFPVLSPYTGYILESNVGLPQSPVGRPGGSPMGGGGMNAKAASRNGSGMAGESALEPMTTEQTSSQLSVREGMYVTGGQSLFKIVDDSRLWAELYFSSTESSQVKEGASIDLAIKGGMTTIPGKIDFVQPFFTEGRQFTLVRSYIKANLNDVRVGQLVTGHMKVEHDAQLYVPEKAVLDLGVQHIAFLKKEGAFTPVRVKTGLKTGGWIAVVEGIDENSEIAENAQYLVDSESFIKVTNP
jgi:Cu(I)/Ag(I) efflux system membrane fusion protein